MDLYAEVLCKCVIVQYVNKWAAIVLASARVMYKFYISWYLHNKCPRRWNYEVIDLFATFSDS